MNIILDSNSMHNLNIHKMIDFFTQDMFFEDEVSENDVNKIIDTKSSHDSQDYAADEWYENEQ